MSLLTLLELTPLLGAVLLYAVPRQNAKLIKQVAFGLSVVTLAVSGLMAYRFKTNATGMQFVESHSWISNFGIRYAVGIDGMALVLILLTTILTPIVFLAGWNEADNGRWSVRTFYVLMLVLESSMIAVFAATDVFLFYVIFEAMLIPVYLLIGGYGRGERSQAAMKFFIAFAIKAPLWPFHTWLPGAAKSATPATSVLLLGVLDKVGTYGMIRFCITLFPHATKTFTPLIIVLAIISILYGAFLAIGQRDINGLIAFTSISHFGFIVLGIFAMTSQGLSGATLYMVNHGFSTAALFLVAGWMVARRNSSQIEDFGGLQRVTPVMAWCFFIAGMSALALPGISSFVSEFLVLVGTFTRYPVAAIFGTTGIVLAALYVLITVQRSLHGPTTAGNEELKDLNLREKIAIAPVIAILILMGFFPKPILNWINPSSQQTMQAAGYSDPLPKAGK